MAWGPLAFLMGGLSMGYGSSLTLAHVAAQVRYRIMGMEPIRCLEVVLDANYLQSTKYL